MIEDSRGTKIEVDIPKAYTVGNGMIKSIISKKKIDCIRKIKKNLLKNGLNLSKS